MTLVKGIFVNLCIPLLVISLTCGTFGAPSSNLFKTNIPSRIPCSSDDYLRASLTGSPSYESQRQSVIGQAITLFKGLSSPKLDAPCDQGVQDLETILLKNLLDCLEALKKNSGSSSSSSPSLPVISKVVQINVDNQYQKLKSLVIARLPQGDAQGVSAALEALNKTFRSIVTGKLLNVELPNLCSKILALNDALTAANPPQDVQNAATELIKLLTKALTGQTQVTISSVCNCLNDLETSIVKAVKIEKSGKIEYLISRLADAVVNAVVCKDAYGGNVVEVVQRHVAKIQQAIQEEADADAEKIYNSVLGFEKQLYNTLTESVPKKAPISSNSNQATIENLKKIIEQLKSVETPGSTTSGNAPNSIVLDTKITSSSPDSVTDENTDTVDDATSVVSDGALFVIKEQVKQEVDDNGNIKLVRSGTYNIRNPSFELSSSGSYAVEDGTINKDSDGNISIRSSGRYDVNLPEDETNSGGRRVKREGLFVIEDMIPAPENSQTTEGGKYVVSDPAIDSVQTGTFEITNSISKKNDDGDLEVIKSGVMYVDGTKPSITAEPSDKNDGEDFLFEDYIFNAPDENGNYGTGIYSIKHPETSETGTYVIDNIIRTDNPDGSINCTLHGVFSSDDSDSTSKIIKNGAEFTFDQYITYVTDLNGQVSGTGNGKLTQIDSETGVTSKNCVFDNFFKTVNPDGSKVVTKIGKFSDSSISPSTIKSSSTGTAKALPVSKDAFEALLGNLKPVETIGQTEDQKVGDSPATGGTQDVESPDYDATVVGNYSAFIVNENITPLRDAEGNIIGGLVLGTYWSTNIDTNENWYGSFEVNDVSIQNSSPGIITIKDTGVFEVNSANNLTSTVDGEFSISFTTNSPIGNTPLHKLTERGTYTVKDVTTSASKSGNLVVTNLISKAQPNGDLEVTKAGFLFPDDSAKSKNEQALLGGHHRYFLFHSSIPEDSSSGHGTYSIKDSETKEYVSGNYIINETFTIENPDGSEDLFTNGIIYLDGDLDDNSTFDIKNGSEFTSVDHIVRKTDENGHVTISATGNFVQTDPETGDQISQNYTIWNFVKVDDICTDGFTEIIKLGGYLVDDSDAVPVDLSTVLSPSSKSTKKSTNKGFALPPDVIKAFVDSSAQVPVSTSEDPTFEPVDIVNDESSFLIRQHIPKQTSAPPRNVKPVYSGQYIFTEPQTSNSWSGDYEVDDVGLDFLPRRERQANIKGSYEVNLPNSTPNPTPAVNFSITEHRRPVTDENGIIRVVEDGSFLLDNPNSGVTKEGKFIVKHNITRINADESTDIIKYGTMYVGDSEIPASDDAGVHILFDDNIFSDGTRGSGVCGIRNLETNEYTSGTYQIQSRFTTVQPDGIEHIKTSGSISLDSHNSSPKSADSDPRLLIQDGLNFTIDDYLSYQTDEYGNTYVAGNGILTQTNSQSGESFLTYYNVDNAIIVNNPDGSQNIVKSGTVQGTSALISDFASSPTHPTPSTSNLTPTSPSKKIKIVGKPSQKPKIGSDTDANRNYVVLTRSDVISALNGQTPKIGDAVVIKANNGDALLAEIREPDCPVTFYVTNLADLAQEFSDATRIWTVPQDNFPERDSKLIDALLSYAHPPCDSSP